MDKELRSKQAFEYVDYATERLKAAGFILKYTSMKSEACYYEHPSRNGLILRVACHRYGRTESLHFPHDLGHVAACITFADTFVPRSWESVDRIIHIAVGQYFVGHIRSRLRKYLPKTSTDN